MNALDSRSRCSWAQPEVCVLVQLKEALGYAAYITCTTFLPNAVNVVTLFYGALSVVKSFSACVLAMHKSHTPCIAYGQGVLCMQVGT